MADRAGAGCAGEELGDAGEVAGPAVGVLEVGEGGDLGLSVTVDSLEEDGAAHDGLEEVADDLADLAEEVGAALEELEEVDQARGPH